MWQNPWHVWRSVMCDVRCVTGDVTPDTVTIWQYSSRDRGSATWQLGSIVQMFTSKISNRSFFCVTCTGIKVVFSWSLVDECNGRWCGVTAWCQDSPQPQDQLPVVTAACHHHCCQAAAAVGVLQACGFFLASGAPTDNQHWPLGYTPQHDE